MDTIFINSENDKTSNPHRILLNLSEKIISEEEVINVSLYQALAFTIHEKI